MKNTTTKTFHCVLALLSAGCVVNSASAIQITRTSGGIIYTDPATELQCAYAAYAISNNTAINYSNIWVKVDSFSGTIVKLAGGDPGLYALDDLAAGQTKMAFVYLQATNITATAQSHTVRVYDGYPTLGVELTNVTFSVTAKSPGENNSSKVDSVTYNPAAPTLGGFITVYVKGDCGQVQNNDTVNFTPAAFTNWNAGAFELVNASIWFTNKNNAVTNVANFLQLPAWVSQWSNGQLFYQAYYQFHAIAITASNTPVSPITYATQGQTATHTPTSGYGAFAPIQTPTNTTVLSKLANVAQLYTNELVTYTVRLTNSGLNNMTVDRVLDTLPTNLAYMAGSSKFNGVTILDPVATGNLLTWSETYAVPAGSSRDLTFEAKANSSGYATNTVIAYVQDTLIDTTYPTTDNVPGTNVIRALQAPTAVNDTGATLEDTVLNVSAPGLLSNDIEPNGFTVTVVSYTQPAHGSVTVNANGSYTYTPAINYNGSDSFTYTLTNANARSSTATVNLTVTAVNDPPGFTKGSDQTVLEDAGAQTVSGWATAISPGPADESGQVVTFHVSNDNNSLFSVQPVLSAGGTLTYTPAVNANGSATVSVYLTDNGGAANGGSDTSATQTFTITVTAVNDPPVANPVTYGRAWGTSMRILKADLLTHASDLDGDTLHVAWAGGGTNGTSITTNSALVLFAPTNNLPESFIYVVGDGSSLATNRVTILVTNAVCQQTITSSGPGSVTLNLAGVPGYAYVVERANGLSGPWATLDGSGGEPDSRTNAPANGLWQFTETPPYSPAFYRTRQNN